MASRTMRRGRLAAALAGVALLAACGEQPIGTFERPQYITQAAQGQLSLRFAPATAELEPGEAARLMLFLEGLALQNWDEVILTFAESGSADLDRARRAATARALAETRTPAAVRLVDTRRPDRVVPAVDTVLVEALRRGQLLVACPGQFNDDWERRFGADLPRMNCSNEANLAHMAANQNDLIVPRVLGPSEGTTSAMAVLRHRTDQVKDPGTTDTTNNR
jgi:type IV pilus biogenesis protein CpaD/CtpE